MQHTDVPGGSWVPRAYLTVAAALIPWTLYLAVTLPQHQTIASYRVTWVGFDTVLIAVLARIGWFAYRRDPRVVLTAAAGATLLVADAWFDIMTAASTGGRIAAIVDAVVLEIPGALLCMALAHRGLATLVARASASPRP